MVVFWKVCVIWILGTLSMIICQTTDNKTVLNECTVRQHYSGFFRSATEQAEVERLWQQTPVKTVTSKYYSRRSCAFRCWWKWPYLQEAYVPLEHGSGVRKQPINAWVEHGCCRSMMRFHAPSTLINCSGSPRTLLQYGSLNQYIPKHECQLSPRCAGCTCQQEASLHMAVVLKNANSNPTYLSDIELDWFPVDGCCKCVT